MNQLDQIDDLFANLANTQKMALTAANEHDPSLSKGWDHFTTAPAKPEPPPPQDDDPCQGRTIWNSDGTDGPCLICPPPPPERKAALAVLPQATMKRSSVPAIVSELKEADQDHEFYPTTDAIISRLASDIGLRTADEWRGERNFASFLDIGAGNGKVLRAIRDRCQLTKLFAIEKSQRLCQELDAEILIVGTSFHEQSLFSKHVDIIFCNPPFSEYEAWTDKIVRQSAAQIVYLVLPERWKTDAQIAEALEFRSVSAKAIGDFDFQDADRPARCKVQLVKIDYRHEIDGQRYDRNRDAGFEKFFKAQFADLIAKFKSTEPDKDPEEIGKVKKVYHELVVGPNYPQAMVGIYNQELAHVEKNYALIAELDADLLREFDVNPDRIMGCLKARLSGLRSEYWNELFAHLTSVTNRLTSESRKKILQTLSEHVQVDFTLDNILAVIVWLLKNANAYIDSQLVETYEKLVDKCNVILYKSNKRTWTDEKWRYCHRDDDDKPSHFALDYRIVTHRVGGISADYSGNHGLDERAATFIKDMMTIARNLGFECDTGDNRLHAYRHGIAKDWRSNEKQDFRCIYQGKNALLFDVRAFQNGNLHFRLNQNFIRALNVEHGRLKGWLRTPREASEELNDPKAGALFKSNLQLPTTDPSLMLTQGGEE